MRLRGFSICAAIISFFTIHPSSLSAQGTAFTYQGRLNNGANAVSGNYDFEFTLYGVNTGGSPITGPVTLTATNVTNGLFTVSLDFGGQFDGTARWLEIAVRTNGVGSFLV